MSAAERFAIQPPGRMQSHPAHGEELAGSDPETFHLHVEFVHAHGVPRGQFTTFSTACAASGAVRKSNSGNGAHGK